MNLSFSSILKALKPQPKKSPDEIAFERFKELLKQDKNHLSSHPVLKHLIERYHAFIYDQGPLEPHREFRDRVSQISVEQHNRRKGINSNAKQDPNTYRSRGNRRNRKDYRDI